jgi:hypothetical protein
VQFEQPALFPVTDIQTRGYAQPASAAPCHCGLGTQKQCDTEMWGCARDGGGATITEDAA